MPPTARWDDLATPICHQIDTVTPTLSKMPTSGPWHLAVSAAVPDSLLTLPTHMSSSYSSTLHVSIIVIGLVNRISNVWPSSASQWCRCRRADPVLPCAPHFHFNLNNMMVPHCPHPPLCLLLPLTTFSSSSMVLHRGTIISLVAVPLLPSPPPCSPLPLTPPLLLVLEHPLVPPRRGCEMVSKISSIPSNLPAALAALVLIPCPLTLTPTVADLAHVLTTVTGASMGLNVLANPPLVWPSAQNPKECRPILG